jgi:uncharacterized delta-60 repeat protein
MRLFVAILASLALSLGALRAQYWETDASFAPVLESPATSVPDLSIGVAGGKLLVRPPYSVNGVVTSLARLNADGSVDASLAAPQDDLWFPLATYPDGRVVVLRRPDSPSSFFVELLRLRSDGTIDPTFAPVTFSPDAPADVELLSGGRLLVVGNFTAIAGMTEPSIAILNDDGSIYTGFHSPFTLPVVGGDLGQLTAAPAPDGKFYVVGPFDELGPQKLRRVARLLPDGSVDPTFNANAVSFPSLAQRAYPQADGRVLVSYAPGWAAGANVTGILRLDSSGALDSTFIPDLSGTRQSFGAQESDGKILYFASTPGSDLLEARRVNADGTADPSFVLTTSQSIGIRGAVREDDGTYYFASPLTAERKSNRFHVTHVLADGSIDPDFSPRISSPADVTTFLRESDGKVIVAGSFDFVNGIRVNEGGPALVRLHADGSRDASFDAALGEGEQVGGLLEQTDGNVIASGTFVVNGQTRTFARFHSTGARDTGFGLPNLMRTDIATDEQGRIYAANRAINDHWVERYTPDGDLDAAFTRIAMSAQSRFAVWPDGRVVATTRLPGTGGAAKTTLSRFSGAGVVDATFAVDPEQLPTAVLALVALPEGRVLAIGTDPVHNGSVSTYTRFDATGAAEYRFRGGSSSNVEELGGVLFDALLAAEAESGTRVRVEMESGSVRDVGANGEMFSVERTSGLGSLGLSLQRRTSLSSPSLELAPHVIAVRNTDPGSIAINGTTTLSAAGGGLLPLSYQWFRNGEPIVGATSATFTLADATLTDAGDYTVVITNDHGEATSAPISISILETTSLPAFMLFEGQPLPRTVTAGNTVILSAKAMGNPLPHFEWFLNDQAIAPSVATQVKDRTTAASQITLSPIRPTDSGIYTVVASSAQGQVVSRPAIVGATTAAKVTGAAREVGANIVHPNGQSMDQILLEGTAASITADAGQVTRMSFIDLDDDIVQIEFTGAGTLTLRLNNESGPAAPSRYTQPGVNYMKGHATIVVVGANETSHLSVFTVGRANAIDQTLFRADVTYDGVADIACIAIASGDGNSAVCVVPTSASSGREVSPASTRPSCSSRGRSTSAISAHSTKPIRCCSLAGLTATHSLPVATSSKRTAVQ